MTTPQFSSNTWYSVQNLGNKFYLDCNTISICGADTTALTNFERFQINQVNANSPFYIRPKAENVDSNGQPFCINLNTGQPFLSLCTNASAIWGMEFWNGRDSGDGLFLYSTQLGSSQRLYLNDNGAWSLSEYNGTSTSDQDHMRWAITSLADINDQSYSTVPAVIGVASAGPATTSASSTVTSASSSSSGATSASTTATGSSRSIASSASSTPNTAQSASTTVVAVTPTVTASTTHSGSGASTAATVSPTLANGAGRSGPSTRALVALSAMVLLQASWLLA